MRARERERVSAIKIEINKICKRARDRENEKVREERSVIEEPSGEREKEVKREGEK